MTLAKPHASRILAVLLLLCPVSLAQAAPVAGERWSPVGPQGGTITALVVAPGTRRTLYAGTDQGVVFRSDDAGATWTYASGAFPAARVAELEVDPSAPGTVYAAICLEQVEFGIKEGGIFKSTDGGRNWRPSSQGLAECVVLETALDPFDPSTLFAATVNGLFQSDDGGASWRRNPGFPVHPASDVVTAVEFDPTTPGTLFAIHRQRGLHKSVDGGATWIALGSGLPAAARDLLGLEFDPRAPGTVYLNAFDARQVPNPAIAPVYRSTDGGATWVPAADGLGGRLVADLAVPRDASVLYAATADGVFRSQDGGRHWTAPGPGAPGAQVLAAPSFAADIVYAGAPLHGVFKSTDGGGSWRAVNRGLTGLRVDALAIAPSNPAVLYAVARGQNVLRSDDGGATWQPAHGGLPVEPFVLAVDPRDPRTAFASQYAGAIWKTTNGGASWRLTTGVETSCVLPLAIVFDPRRSRTLYTAGFRVPCPLFPDVCQGFKSTDGGESWTCMDDLVDEYFSLAVDPADPARLFLGGMSEILTSADAGGSWTGSGPGVHTGVFVGSLAIPPGGGGATGVIYAGTASGLYRRAGGVWSRIARPLFPGPAQVAAAPSNPAVLYGLASVRAAPHDARLYRSPNGGATSRRVTLEGLPLERVASVIVDPARPRVVYTLTRAGIYRLSPTPDAGS